MITDSDTALELYRRKLTDPMKFSPEDRADTPSYLFDLVTAEDGQLVGRPVNQFVQLACFNKERLEVPPETLEDMEQESESNNFGMALQLKNMFWSAEAFDENGIGIPFPQRQVYPMEWPPSKEQTHRIGSPSNQLQPEANSDAANDSTGETS